MDNHKQSRPFAALLRGLRRWWKHPFSTRFSETHALYEDILRQAAQTQSLEDSLHRFPRRLVAALELASFHIFILNQGDQSQQEYRLLNASLPPIAFPASSAVVARMKRDRRPSQFVVSPSSGQTPQAWQMLATQDEIDLLLGLDTQLLFPLEGRTRLIGFVSISRSAHSVFSDAELCFLRDLGPQMGRGLETALFVRDLNLQAVVRDRAARELAVAREVQERLLPRELPRLPGLDLAAFYQSAEQVGGDYYDAFLTTKGALCLVIADVSGKGVPAALLMAALRASLHALGLQPELSLANMLQRLNTLLFQSSSANRYATLFLCLYHPATQTLEYSNAGHNPPVLVHPDRRLQRLSIGGTVLGLFPQAEFATERIPFPPGSALVAYTDGITESTDPTGREWGKVDFTTRSLLPLRPTHQHLYSTFGTTWRSSPREALQSMT